MKCPSCDCENTKVIDSRVSDGGLSIRRRRECEQCEFRFTTFERLQAVNLMVEKKDGTSEPYDRAKLEKGILIACAKRPISIEQLREKLTALEEKWGKEKVIASTRLGSDIVETLKEIDEIAYIRFASVYKQFKDVETFKRELAKILD